MMYYFANYNKIYLQLQENMMMSPGSEKVETEAW